MARTKYGKLTGRAASAELRDQREFLDEMADPNSRYWQDKLAGKKEQILKNPHCKAVWDSPLVSERATYREHAEIAQAILNGELDEQYRILQNITPEAHEEYMRAAIRDFNPGSHDPQNSESILSLTDRAAAEQDERFAAAVRQFADGELNRAIDILDRAGEAIDELTKDEISEALVDVNMELPDECGLQFTDGELADAMDHDPSDSVKQAWELSRDDRSFRFAPERNVPPFAFRDYVTRKVTAGID